jgi:ADP-heptose:LPS heptosyltransferase
MERFLILRFSSIGDIVLTSPVVRGLRQAYPQARIDYLTKKSFVGLWSANPYLDEVWGFEKSPQELLETLKSQKYDFVIDLHNNWASFWLRQGLRGVKSFVFKKRNLDKWLLTGFGLDFLSNSPRLHTVSRYLETVASLGVQYDGQGLDYFIPDAAKVRVEDFGLLPNEYSVLVLGAAHATKQIPADKLLWMCERLRKKTVLLGGQAEKALAEQLIQCQNPNLVNTCGGLNLNQSASLIAQSARVLAPDTGFMHISAALGKPLLMVWGNTVPALGFAPFYPDSAEKTIYKSLEVKGLKCRPCSKLGKRQCPKKHFDCMQRQDYAQMVDFLNGATQT